MSELWVGLIGIVVGTALSLTGSVIVGRIQLGRQARVDIWEIALPEIQRKWFDYMLRRKRMSPTSPLPPVPDVRDHLYSLLRKAVLAGRRDAQASEKLWEAWKRCVALSYEGLYGPKKKEDAREYEVILKELAEVEEVFNKTLSTYKQYVRRRLRWS